MGEAGVMLLWSLAGLVAAVYCVVQGIDDIRRRRFVWGALGICSGAVILFTPIQTHAVRIDLPLAAAD